MSAEVDDVGAELRSAVTRLYSRFRSERVEGEVSEAALLVLVVLGKRGPMSLSDLADAGRVTLGSVSQTVRRLEELGHITKARATDDRRKVIFTLTEQGRDAADASRRHREDWLNHRLTQLTAGEQDDIRRVASLLLHIADS